MSHAKLAEPDNTLEYQMLETMMAGLNGVGVSSPNYPKSASDMQSCIRALIKMFDIKRRPLAKELKYKE